MTALQKVNLGTAPTGTDGDTVRTANVKANANVDVLSTQATLTSSSPNAVRDLTVADMGKRINFTPTAAATVHFPAAATTGADQLVAVHNLATAYDITMAIATGSGDASPVIVVVKPGEMLTWETDGVSVWRTIGRKKALDEVVQGKLTVAGAFTASGTVNVTGAVTASGTLNVTGAITAAGTLTAGGATKVSYAGATSWINDTSGNSQGGYGYQSNGSAAWATWLMASRDWGLQRYVNGAPVDNPIYVSNATGLVTIGTLSVANNATVAGTLGVTGQTTLSAALNFATAAVAQSSLGALGAQRIIAVATHSGSYTVPTTTALLQAYDAPTRNVGGGWNSSNGVFTAPVAGMYLVTGRAFWNTSGGSGVAALRVFLNGGEFQSDIKTIATGQYSLSVCAVVYVAAGTTIDFRVSCSTSTTSVADGPTNQIAIVQL
ncbi:hypothetical protein VSR34_00965 [Paraburkholderia sp. JHI2823]|uniref:hypothetical protein n=1 Tax=Paraburkholderia sp. JHI2823 TaxID=3112960 RepID=UPI0031705278